MKNTVNGKLDSLCFFLVPNTDAKHFYHFHVVFAKTSPHVLVPELFALHLGLHFVKTYKHIHQSSITVISHRWTRIPISDKPHPHAFSRDGVDVVQVEAVVKKVTTDAFSATLVSGLKDLLVLKTTGSAFENFIRDEVRPHKPLVLT